MKITYTPNPLAAVVELDEHETEILRLKMKIEQYEDLLYGAHFSLTQNEWYSKSIKPRTLEEVVDEARKSVDPDYWCSDNQSKLDERVNQLLELYLHELKMPHVGDCTAVPMSCIKCHAETILGIDTLGTASKFVLNQIYLAFSRWNPETKLHDKSEVSLDEAIEKLRTYNPTATWDGWEQYAHRWAIEVKEAHAYLVNYRNTHFGENNMS